MEVVYKKLGIKIIAEEATGFDDNPEIL